MSTRLTGATWAAAFESVRTSAFRWETQGVYREPDEREAFQHFLAGHQPDYSFLDGWLAGIQHHRAEGRTFSRVRVLTDPLTDYLRFELSFTHLNVAAGEDVRFLSERQRVELRLPNYDFWLFDDALATPMHFGPDGFEYADVVTEPARLAEFREIRDLAWKEALPYGEHQRLMR